MNREYWPFGIIQFPAIVYWLWLSIRSRSFVFFSASNPGIPMGGMFGESKYQVLSKIPAACKPRTLLVRIPATLSAVKERMREAGLKLPVIFKPDIGERGLRVKKIKAEHEMRSYLEMATGDFLVQECVELPLEFGVFYMRHPQNAQGQVISVTGKEMLSVTGDGKSGLRELILRSDRAKLQWQTLRVTFAETLDRIIPSGEKVELVSIGNHCLGTRFINASYLISDRLSEAFDDISRNIPGFYFGRFDLRCATHEDLCCGKVQIMELNGCGAEPGHIYDADFSLWQALKVPVIYWDHIFRIARANRKRGVRYATHGEALAYYRKFRAAVR